MISKQDTNLTDSKIPQTIPSTLMQQNTELQFFTSLYINQTHCLPSYSNHFQLSQQTHHTFTPKSWTLTQKPNRIKQINHSELNLKNGFSLKTILNLLWNEIEILNEWNGEEWRRKNGYLRRKSIDSFRSDLAVNERWLKETLKAAYLNSSTDIYFFYFFVFVIIWVFICFFYFGKRYSVHMLYAFS